MSGMLRHVSDWSLKSYLVDINGERVEFIKKQFVLDKGSHVTVPDRRSKEFKEYEALEWLSRRGLEVFAIRCIKSGVPFDGAFVDSFEAYVREKKK